MGWSIQDVAEKYAKYVFLPGMAVGGVILFYMALGSVGVYLHDTPLDGVLIVGAVEEFAKFWIANVLGWGWHGLWGVLFFQAIEAVMYAQGRYTFMIDIFVLKNTAVAMHVMWYLVWLFWPGKWRIFGFMQTIALHALWNCSLTERAFWATFTVFMVGAVQAYLALRGRTVLDYAGAGKRRTGGIAGGLWRWLAKRLARYLAEELSLSAGNEIKARDDGK